MASLGMGSVLAAPSVSVDTAPKDSLQDFFAKIDGISGESKDSKHSGQIDVLSWAYAVSQSSSTHTGGGGGVGKANFSELVFTHYVDKSSPNLLTYCAGGKHISSVELSCCKVGDGQQEYCKITLSDVLITHVRPVGATNSPRLIEEVGMSYGKIKMEVKEQNSDGSLGAAVTGTWMVKENKKG
ncbi:type VI secretion system secreted protein Hcp [Tahibacter aquaticus]|uniref:Type VI secretion system secreted protein Hcp n=2 Tax=Tahibacter aquaticus TaxID=520092 RepID=A0A4R6Z7R6_9GAMM|nr:type VI secretion system secreted protein Hcp [Tahibacter aquaticus]